MEINKLIFKYQSMSNEELDEQVHVLLGNESENVPPYSEDLNLAWQLLSTDLGRINGSNTPSILFNMVMIPLAPEVVAHSMCIRFCAWSEYYG